MRRLRKRSRWTRTKARKPRKAVAARPAGERGWSLKALASGGA